MRSPDEVRKRLESWEAEGARFFPPLVVGRISFETIVSELLQVLDLKMGVAELESRVQDHIVKLRGSPRSDEATKYVMDSVVEELSWVLGKDPQGALRKVIWDILIFQLHDAECSMTREGNELTLQGTGFPYDPEHPKRSFQFSLQLKEAKLEDGRQSPLPVEKIWIFRPKPADPGFAFTAQDDTLSGMLTFSGTDYEYRIWSHSA